MKQFILCLLILPLLTLAETFTYTGLTYSNSDTITPGEWNCRFSKAKTLAANNNIPLVVVWANPPCGYCKTFESSVGKSAEVKEWMKKRGYVMAFGLGRETSSTYGTLASDMNSMYSYAWYSLTGTKLDAYPFVAVYWKKGPDGRVVKANFVGRTGKMPVKKGTLAQQFMDSVDSLVGDYADMAKVAVVASPATAGTVSGGGAYEVGASVALKATIKSGNFFSGWYEGDKLLSRSPSYTHVVGPVSTTLTAKYITKEQDAASIALRANGVPVENGTGLVMTNTVLCGVALSWPLEVSALTATTVTASGLPSGVKLVKDKTTGALSLSGAPKTASKINARTGLTTPTFAKIKVTTGARNTQTFSLAFIVEALPAWASGTYNGGGDGGQVTMTVTAGGKLSGKYLSEGKSWTLSAPYYSSFSAESSMGAFEVIGKNGKVAFTNTVTVAPLKVDAAIGVLEGDLFKAYRNLWKVEPRKSLAKILAKNPAISYETVDPEGRNGVVTLTFGASGTVRVKGVFEYGVNAKGRPLTVTMTGSAVLCAQSDSDCRVFVYLPPKIGKFAGLVDILLLTWDGETLKIF